MSVGVYVGVSGCKAEVKVKVKAAETKEDEGMSACRTSPWPMRRLVKALLARDFREQGAVSCSRQTSPSPSLVCLQSSSTTLGLLSIMRRDVR